MSEQSFLSKLRFDPKLENSAIASYLFNPRLAILAVLLTIIIGTYSFLNLPRVLNPEINIPIVIVNTILPGAGPKDIESLITIPLEDSVDNLARISKISSTSRDSVSTITLEFESGVDAEKARSDVQAAVDAVGDLPEDAIDPNVIKLDFTNAPVWTFALSGDTDTGSLMRYTKILQERIQTLPSVDRVEISGFQEEEIQIILNQTALSSYKVNIFQLSQGIQNTLKSFPAGNVKSSQSNFSLSLDPSVTSLEKLRLLPVSLNNTIVPLGDLAEISIRTKPGQTPSLLTHDKKTTPAVVFNIFKTSTANIDESVEEVKKLFETENQLKQGEFKIFSIIDSAEEITNQFKELQKDFLITVGLVFIVLFIFLGIRQAIIASLAIPLTFLISVSVMYFTGIDLSFISLFSLLLALGLLVDDTIVVASAITAYYRTSKFTPIQAGLLVWRDFLIAIFTTTVTTVWAFLPLLLATGIIGEFIKPIPIVVSSTLMASFIVAMFITLPFVIMFLQREVAPRVKILGKILGISLIGFILYSLLPKGNLFLAELLALLLVVFITFTVKDLLKAHLDRFIKDKLPRKNTRNIQAYLDEGVIHFGIISDRYHSLIESILSSASKRRLTVAMVLIFSLFSFILLPLGFVKNEFFPRSDQKYLYLSLSLPSGTNQDQAISESEKIVSKIEQMDEFEFVTTEIGQGISQMSGGSQEGQGANIVLFSLLLKDGESSIEMSEILRSQFKTYTAGTLSVVEVSGGPPAGSDLQITLFGNDLPTLSVYADKLQANLETKSGVINVNKSIKEGTSKVTFVPNLALIAEKAITLDQIGFWLRTYATGFSVDSVTFSELDDEEKDITIRVGKDSQSIESIGAIQVPTSQGNTPLAGLGTFVLENNPTLITREDGKRSIAITAGVRPGFSISTLNSELETFANSLKLPSGYSWKTGGVNEENQNSVNSILAAMLLSFLLIIITMVLQFGSFRRALIVMLVIPLSISGVFIVFALTGTPLSFPALIGVLALFGIVVKNAILVVDKIIQNQKAGLSFIPSIADAAASRLEAIALTSVATIMGLIPVTVSDPLWRGLGGAIIAGLTFSGTIMLFFIPVVYYYWFAPKTSSSKK